MSDQFIGEIRMFAGDFAIANWALCNGQIVPIAQNTALFSLLGTVYGGNGSTTFGLPNLQGRIPMHQGQSAFGIYDIGEQDGTESVTLTTNEIPSHTHLLNVNSSPGFIASPQDARFAAHRDHKAFGSTSGGAVPLAPLALMPSGGNQAHENMPPCLCVTFIIALQGVFPQRQ